MVDGLAAADALEYDEFLIVPLRRDQDGHRLADDFGGRIAEEPLGSFVPAGDDAIEVLTDDRVVRGLDDGGEPLHRLPRPACAR